MSPPKQHNLPQISAELGIHVFTLYNRGSLSGRKESGASPTVLN